MSADNVASWPVPDSSSTGRTATYVILAVIAITLALGGILTATVSDSPSLQQGGFNFGASAACNADAKTIETAVGTYNAQFTPSIVTEQVGNYAGQISPGNPSTYSTGTQAQLLIANGLLRSWPGASNGYSMSLSTTKAGDVTVYVPADNPVGTDFESETSTTGCNALF